MDIFEKKSCLENGDGSFILYLKEAVSEENFLEVCEMEEEYISELELVLF